MPFAGPDDWTHMVQDSHRDLLNYLRGRLRNQDDAADIAQDAYVRLLDHAPAEEIRSHRAYLFRTANNLAINHAKRASWQARQRGRIAEDLKIEGDRDTGTPEAILMGRQAVADIARALEALPDKCRQAFMMHRFQERSYNDIASEMGVSRSMVEKHIIRALDHLRRHIDSALLD